MRFAFLLILLPIAFAQTPRPTPPPPDVSQIEGELKKFTEVLSLVDEFSAEPVPLDQVVYGGAIPGMLRRLDPHSIFFNRDQFEQLQEMERSMSKGFGTVVSVTPGRVIILQTIPGSPSQKSGLSPGDEIVAINNIPLSRLEQEQIIQLLGMARQRPAQLYVRRTGTAGLLPFTLTPAEMQSPSVDRAFLIEPGIGYVRVRSFEGNTAEQVKESIEKLGGAQLKGLVLDLRDNPGGVLPASLATAALFLKPGQRILSARGRAAKTQDVDVPADAKPYEFPLAILVDHRSASAAEIVAGAVQDHDRGVVLGESTFGKGLVQSVFPLSGDNGLALTTAFYYTPSGRSIQRPLEGTELAASTANDRPEYKSDSGRTVRGGGGIEPDVRVAPPMHPPLAGVLEETASFQNFATEWLAAHGGVAKPGMEISPEMLDEFQLWLSRRRIRPTLSEWSAQRDRIQARLLQELLNQAVSVEAGDEIELRRDPFVVRALQELRAEPRKP